MKHAPAAAAQPQPVDELARACSLLAGETDFNSLASTLAEQALDASRSDLAALYLCTPPGGQRGDLRLYHRRGRFAAADRLDARDPLVELALECGEAVVALERRPGLFAAMLLDPAMRSGIAVPLSRGTRDPAGPAAVGLLMLNSVRAFHYDRRRLGFLESCCRLASGMLESARLFQSLEEALARVQELERLQARIFASMTGLLLTTDESGRLLTYNRAAAERLRLVETDLGRPLSEVLGRAVEPPLLRALEKAAADGDEMLGLRGICRLPDGQMDFALSAAPLPGQRNGGGGMTILITDESREREMARPAAWPIDEGRLVKDAFESSLPAEVVSHLVESPRLAGLDGDYREATVLFADLQGYGELCDGRDPRLVIEALNEYFGEAVAAVLRHRGFVDRLLGGAIVAVWGVPLQSIGDDARGAVAAALEIQAVAASRNFGQLASRLAIGAALHTGRVVAGTLGSGRRASYSVLGDTVTMAARLQAAAGPDEVIITEETRRHLGEDFAVEPRRAVRVKGRGEPVPAYRVLRRTG